MQQQPPPSAQGQQQQQQQQRPRPPQQQQPQQGVAAAAGGARPNPSGMNGAPRPANPAQQQQQQQMQRPLSAQGQMQRPPQQQQQGGPPMQRPPSAGGSQQGQGQGPPPMQRAPSMTGQPMRPQVNPNAPMQPGMSRNGPPSSSSSSGGPSPSSASSRGGGVISGSTSARRGSPSPSPAPARVIEMVDDIPLVAEVYENQRYYPMVGWSRKLMDLRPAWSNEDGTEAKVMEDFKVPPGWSWGGEWAVDVVPGQTDAEGWSYATEFSRNYKGSPDGTLKAVRRRRHFRRRVPPAKSVKAALGLSGPGGAGANALANSLTVGYLKNPLAVASHNSLSVRGGMGGAYSNTMTMRAGAARPAGPSLAELYAKQTVDAPAPAAGSATGAAAAAAGGAGTLSPSPPPVLLGASGADSSGASSVGSSASSTLTAAAASALSSSLHDATTNGSGSSSGGFMPQPASDSPNMKPKYTPFSSISMGGLDSLSAPFSHGSGGLGGGVGGAFSFSFTGGGSSKPPEKSMVRLWEFQRYYPVVGWSATMLPTDKGGRKGGWINDGDGRRCEAKEQFSPGEGWRWNMEQWTPSVDSSTDVDGWSYAIEPSMQYHAKKSMEHFVRRRLWQREKIQVPSGGRGGAGAGANAGPRKSYVAFFERLEYFKRDLRAEEKDDDLVSLTSATW